MSLLNAGSPDLAESFALLGVELLWHPSLSAGSHSEWRRLNRRLLADKINLDVLVVEGSIIRGPGGTGMFDVIDGRPKKQLAFELAHRARHVIAAGTCASFGGIPADGVVEATGLQFHKLDLGGFLGADFTAAGGRPVINLAGCPVHPDVVTGLLSSLVHEVPVVLDAYNRPQQFYGMVVHQGCTRNEYHEYRVEEVDFGERGCLFFHMGCQGPLTFGPCNKLLWNRRSTKTRVGVPCSGCARPDFPRPYPFFATRNIEGIPMDLPDGVKRAHYMVYKGMAAAAAPTRLVDRESEI
jgi:hydrogenase small subunit